MNKGLVKKGLVLVGVIVSLIFYVIRFKKLEIE